MKYKRDKKPEFTTDEVTWRLVNTKENATLAAFLPSIKEAPYFWFLIS
jgi:hypothetical protein